MLYSLLTTLMKIKDVKLKKEIMFHEIISLKFEANVFFWRVSFKKCLHQYFTESNQLKNSFNISFTKELLKKNTRDLKWIKTVSPVMFLTV